MRRAFRFRLRILASILLLVAFFLVTRLYFVQIIHGSDFALRAQRQYISSSQQLYDRGNIYFTRKDGTPISAATLETGFMIAVHPQEIRNPNDVFAKLSPIIPLDAATYNPTFKTQ
jgi:cell division protein FtsI/penicillin-binding protein 2